MRTEDKDERRLIDDEKGKREFKLNFRFVRLHHLFHLNCGHPFLQQLRF